MRWVRLKIKGQANKGGARMDGLETKGAVKRFTWRELSALNKPENAHVAYDGKVKSAPSPLSLTHFFMAGL